MTAPTLTTLDRFAKSLGLALHDARAERQGGLRLFCDADTLVPMILGFRQDETERPSQRTLVTRALLSLGFLGEVFLLRPHAMEVDQRLRCEPRSDVGVGRALFIRRMHSYLRDNGATEVAQRLQGAISSGKPDDAIATEFVQILQTADTRTFVAVEQVYGSWEHRLSRLWKNVIRFERLDREYHQLFGTPEFERLHQAIARRRSDARKTMGNLRDAAALTLLAHDVGESQQSQGRLPEVRFHSVTPALLNVIAGDPEVRHLLWYPEASTDLQAVRPQHRDAARCILRDGDYLIVRATFSSLSRFASDQTPRAVPTEDEAELTRVYEHLCHLQGSPAALAVTREIRIADRTLHELLEEFENLSFVRRLLSDANSLAPFRAALKDFRQVWQFVLDNRTALDDGTASTLNNIVDALGDSFQFYKDWIERYRAIRTAIATLHSELADFVFVSVMRDLGLVRWGVQLTTPEHEALKAAIEGIRGDDHERKNSLARRLAVACVDGSDGVRSREAAYVLWLLRRFADVATVIERSISQQPEPPEPSLEVMRAAATFRADTETGMPVRETILARLALLGRNLSGEARGRYLLGYGYVLFHCWLWAMREEAKVPGPSAMGGVAERWGRDSYACGLEAEGLLRQDTVEWAFAVNHCVYVGLMIGGDRAERNRYLEKLASIRGVESRGWHYRFADTLSQVRLAEARELWASARGRRGKQRVRREVLRLIEAARREAPDDMLSFGDPEIQEHRQQIESFVRSIESDKSAMTLSVEPPTAGFGKPE